jgi:hypothetical protein
MILFAVSFWIFSKIVLIIGWLFWAQATFQISDIIDEIIAVLMADPNGWITPEIIMNSFKWIGEMTIWGYIRSFIESLLNVFGTVLGIIYFFLLFKILQIDNGEWELEIDNVSGRKMDDHNPQVSKNERGMIEEL